MTKKYWHELTNKEQEQFIKDNKHMRFGEFMKMFSQPNWCSYPEALFIGSGCWELTGGDITKIEKGGNLAGGIIHKIADCGKCDHIKNKEA